MAFDDLTPNQIQTLTQLIEALNSGSFSDEFVMTRTIGQEFHTIQLYDKGKVGISGPKLKGFTSTDIQTLKDEGYIVISGRGLASLKAKALHQYKKYQEERLNEMSEDLHLARLKKVYEATGGSQRKAVNLAEVFKDDGLSKSELENEIEYMEGEHWIKSLGDEGIDFYITHESVKAYQLSLQNKKQSESANLEQANNKVSNLDIFISHSSEDLKVAKALTTLLMVALNIPSTKIRCTSVPGFMFDSGTPIDEQIILEVHDSTILIGLITPTSAKSPYVLFELGARWGARRDLALLLASGADASTLPSPLAKHSALRGDDAAQVQQFIEGIATRLGLQLERASAYQGFVKELVSKSKMAGKRARKKVVTEKHSKQIHAPEQTKDKAIDAGLTEETESLHPRQHVAPASVESVNSNLSQVATQWLKEFLSPVISLAGEIKKEFAQNAFAVERVSAGPQSSAYMYRINFFRRERWNGLITSDIGEYFLDKFPHIEERLSSFRKNADNFDQSLNKLEKSIEESPFLLKQLKDTYERLISRERIPRSEYENSNLQAIAQLVLGQIHMEISKHPTEAKDNLVLFIAYSLLGLGITFNVNSLSEDQQLFYFCRDISNDLSVNDRFISESLEATKQLFVAISNESSILHQQLKRERIEIAERFNATF